MSRRRAKPALRPDWVAVDLADNAMRQLAAGDIVRAVELIKVLIVIDPRKAQDLVNELVAIVGDEDVRDYRVVTL
jgi:hypothetical protein